MANGYRSRSYQHGAARAGAAGRAGLIVRVEHRPRGRRETAAAQT